MHRLASLLCKLADAVAALLRTTSPTAGFDDDLLEAYDQYKSDRKCAISEWHLARECSGPACCRFDSVFAVVAPSAFTAFCFAHPWLASFDAAWDAYSVRRSMPTSRI